jgi:four helix bundle protein
MRNFQNLNVWKRSREFVLNVYDVIKNFPKEERFNITDQLRRASVSIPTNIAEGAGRYSDKEFLRFIQIAIGSASEVENLLILSKDLSICNEKKLVVLIEDVIIIRKMLIALTKKIRNS